MPHKFILKDGYLECKLTNWTITIEPYLFPTFGGYTLKIFGSQNPHESEKCYLEAKDISPGGCRPLISISAMYYGFELDIDLDDLESLAPLTKESFKS